MNALDVLHQEFTALLAKQEQRIQRGREQDAPARSYRQGAKDMLEHCIGRVEEAIEDEAG